MSDNTKPTNDYRAYAAMLAAALLWSSDYVIAKFALEVFQPISIIFLRMSVSSVCCLALIPLLKLRITYKTGDWKWLLLMVLCEPGLYFIFEGYALEYTSAEQAGMLTSVTPIFVGLGAWFFLKEKLSKIVWVGCIITIIGVICLNAEAVAGKDAPNPLLGNSLELIAALFGGGYAICVRRLSANYPPMFITAAQACGGFIFFLPLMLTPAGAIPPAAPLSAWAAILYLGVFASFGAYSLYNYSLGKMPAGKVTVYLNLIPVFTLILGMLILGEYLSSYQYMACILVLGGVFISQLR